MLEVKNLSISFKRKTIIQDISCNFEEGIHGLLGPNGAGKTTFMRGIAGLYPCKGKTILLDGETMLVTSLGYLPQKFGLFSNMNVTEALTYIASMKNIPGKNIKQSVQQVIERVNLNEKAKEKIHTLSGGMIQRVGIAQAILGDPKVIIMDEPTVGLDPEERIRIKNLIREIGSHKIIIISTHIVDDVNYLCDYVEIMNDGKLIVKDTCAGISGGADDKVYGVSESQLQQIQSEYYVVSDYQECEEKKYRVIIKDKELMYDKLMPSIEDGYLCILKNL